jgi:hypothetical protein
MKNLCVLSHDRFDLKEDCISVPARSLSSPHSYSAFFIQTLDTTVQPLLLSHSRFRSFLLCTTQCFIP